MLYVLKFLVGWALPPGLFVLLLLAMAVLLFRRNGKRTAWTLACTGVALYLCSTLAFAEALVRPLERTYAPPAHIHADVMIMLGGGATSDTPDVSGTGMLTGSAANRLLTVARLYRQTHLPIIVSGGKVYSDDAVEADVARRQLLDLGVPDSTILVENRSLNTAQNALYSKQLMAAHGFHTALVVTSAFHMPRAIVDFRKEGVVVQPYPTDYLTTLHPHWYVNQFAPNGYAAYLTWTALHEYLGILQARLG